MPNTTHHPIWPVEPEPREFGASIDLDDDSDIVDPRFPIEADQADVLDQLSSIDEPITIERPDDEWDL